MLEGHMIVKITNRRLFYVVGIAQNKSSAYVMEIRLYTLLSP